MTTNPYITQNTPMGQGGQRNAINPHSPYNQQNTPMRQGGQEDGVNPYSPYNQQNTPMGQGGQRNVINPYSTNNQQNTQMGQGGQEDGANPYFLQTTQNQQNPQVPTNTIMGIDTKNFLIGAAIGAAGAYLLTNENAQKAIFKTIAKGSSMFQTGIEEIKERFEDAKAELEASK